ncbi:MAG TPA: chemotaxis protein CheW [Gemmatimonadaceae bacterium]|nr:chemotaxis protein CheW [Gemmatimonadaceae bacterium]
MSASPSQLVTFRLGPDRFAADIFAVERVLRYTPPTPVPNLPEWLAGVLDYQSRVVPVLDLRARLGLERAAPRLETRIIVFSVDDDWIGAVVDAVLEVVPLAAGELSPPPPLFRGLAADYLLGLVRRPDGLLIVLDVRRLLTATERLALTRAEEAARGG